MRKKGRDILIGGLMILLVLCFFAPAVHAQGNITLGRLAVHPGIEVSVDFWDNIFLASEMATIVVDGQERRVGKQDDILYTLTPSIVMGYEDDPGNYLNFGIYADFTAYDSFDDNNYERYDPFIYYGFKSPMGFYLKAFDVFLWTGDPYGSINTYGEGQHIKRWNNKLNLVAGYEFNAFAVELMYQNYLEGWDRQIDQWQDRMDNVGGISFLYKLSGKTTILGEYRYTKGEYVEQNDGIIGGGKIWTSVTSQDYTLNYFLVGARFEPGGKLTGEVKVGYGTKTFENEFDPAGNPYKDEGDFISETLVGYNITDRTYAEFNFQRAPLGSPDGDAASFMDTRFELSLAQKFAYRLSARLGIDYDIQDYRNMRPGKPDKKFNVYGWFAEVNYDIQDWLKVGADYEYVHKQASDTNYVPYLLQEYKSNMFTIKMSAIF